MKNVIKLLKELINFKSITPNDAGAFKFIKEMFQDKDFEIFEIDKNGVKNLFLYKKYGEAKNKHLCFAGHIDVVPAGENWNTDPFFATQKDDGFIYGRGTQDMKGGVASFLSAIEETENFDGILSIILTSDEEGEAKYGTLEVLKFLKEKYFYPDYVIVAEPTCENKFGDAIKVGRRGSINGVIEIFGEQGHAAYPEKVINPINILAPILPKIAGINLDDGDEFFSPSKIVITDIRGGMEVSNVTPANVKIMFNVRNNTKTTKDDIEFFINKEFKKVDFSLKLEQSSKGFITNRNSKIIDILVDSIKKVTNITPKLSTAGGTSDARFISEYGMNVIEFGVINDRIHSINERVSIDEIVKLKDIFKKVINSL